MAIEIPFENQEALAELDLLLNPPPKEIILNGIRMEVATGKRVGMIGGLKVADHHEQQREYSCVQSAVELVLKLYGVIGWDSYPEQCHEILDRKGFEPYARMRQKS